MQPQQTTLQCSNCGTPNPVQLRRVVDAQRDPQGKQRLLQGQVNAFQCQNCGQVNNVSSPLLYHDASKELLIAFVPMDVALRGQQTNRNEEQMVGDLMNDLTSNIPKEEFKAYMFSPKRALTMKGLIEQILEADGITPEMIAEQESRVELIESLLQAKTEDELIALVQGVDDQINEQLMQTMSMMGQRLMQQGQQQLAGQLMAVQQVILENSTYGESIVAAEEARGEILDEVAERLQAFGEDLSRDDVLSLVLEFKDSEDHLQAIVAYVRPVFDYEFFMKFSEHISKAPAAEREELEKVRDDLREMTDMVDQQNQMIVQQKAQFLQAVINSPQPEQLLRANMQMLDDNFMAVLSANIQEAEKRQDPQLGARLKEIYEITVQILQAQMSPELRFLNSLLTAESAADMQQLVADNADQFGLEELIEVTHAVEQMFTAQGQNAAVQRIQQIRETLQQPQ